MWKGLLGTEYGQTRKSCWTLSHPKQMNKGVLFFLVVFFLVKPINCEVCSVIGFSFFSFFSFKVESWAARKQDVRPNDRKRSIYLMGDLILFRVIDLVCHLFLHFPLPPLNSVFCFTWESALVIDEPDGVHSPHPSTAAAGVVNRGAFLRRSW